MKTKLHLFIALLVTFSISNAQEVTVNLSMAPGYTNQVFYKLKTQTVSSYAADSWDIAFLRTSAMNHGIRVNDHLGIEVFEAAQSSKLWNYIDIDDESNWTQLYNSDTEWNEGAFMQGSATYGWGEYNTVNHHIVGSIIYVLKYNDGTYVKFINQDYYGGYTFKYSTWDATNSTWSPDQTATVSNSSNPNNQYNYYSLQNNQEVVAEPASADWDLKFTKYYTLLSPDTYHLVTGVLHSDEVTVAQNLEESGIASDPTLNYSTDINTIGYDWKSFSMQTFSYTVNADNAFYIKYADDTVYRMYFTDFVGSASGNIGFNFQEITQEVLTVAGAEEEITFGVYPNPSVDKKVNVVFDLGNSSATENKVSIFKLTGENVFEASLGKNKGFYNKTLDLSSLSNGVYMLKFNFGNTVKTTKLVLR